MSLSPQEVILKIVDQGVFSRMSNGVTCVYRHPKNPSVRCAIGHLISDEDYTADLEGRAFLELPTKIRDKILSSPLPEHFWCELQRLHDTAQSMFDFATRAIELMQYSKLNTEAVEAWLPELQHRLDVKRRLESLPDDHSSDLWICSFTSDINLMPIFSTWEHYSGQPDFPVPHPTLSPYLAYMNTENRWDRDTEYGALRWNLLAHVIRNL